MGTNRLVGTDAGSIVEAAMQVLSEKEVPHSLPPLWDGKAAARIKEVLLEIARQRQI
jgi:UDP-N-acetylglucosamine 2-epimerase